MIGSVPASINSLPPKVSWPGGRDFAFSVFDDPDYQTLAQSRRVYGFLADAGFRTTKGVWPTDHPRESTWEGDTCGSLEYGRHALDLQEQGFEIGFHNAAPRSTYREEIVSALENFKGLFGQYPRAMANHSMNADAIYWGPNRLTGSRRLAYRLLTLGRRSHSEGSKEGSPRFWGDICRDRIEYCRNFVYREINTLKAAPWMPYYDPHRPYVNQWYSGTEGANKASYVDTLEESAQDRLEAEGGACIMYTHFGLAFCENGQLDRRFETLMRRLSKKNGWFAPVSAVLDHIRKERGEHTISDDQRRRLETNWLLLKAVHGSS